MRKYTLEELKSMFIGGFEDEKPKPKEGGKPESKEGEEPPEEEDDDDDETSDDDDDDDDPKGRDTTKLKSALDKERKERKRLEKENRANAKRLKALEDKDKTESEKAKGDAAEATEKAKNLSAKLLKNSVDTAIIKMAGKFNFADIDDALRLVDRNEIDVEQDEDDPSDVEIDEKTVEAALKALAKSKPHLVKKSTDDDDDEDDTRPHTGSKFNRNGKKKVDEKASLAEKYPALGRRS